MSKLIFVPLENLEQRYTRMMNDCLDLHFDIVVEGIGGIMPRVIKKGQFLDITGTINYKASQLGQIADLFDAGKIESGDVFLFGDIFFPGLESVKYMAELLGINIKIAAFNYAGRADETDFVRQLGAWSDHSEQGWHECCDLILCGSEFHRKRVVSYFRLPDHKVKNTGYVWDPDWVERVYQGASNITNIPIKENYVIWPHRLCFEKGVDILFRYALQTSRKIIITTCGNKDQAWEQFAGMENVEYRHNLTKQEYYDYLANAEFYLSTARQETFGYTLQEALHFGCKCLAPNRACYNEFLPIENLYDKEADIDSLFEAHNAFATAGYPIASNVTTIMDAVKSLI